MKERLPMVLFPSGQPATSANRERCAALLVSCGADTIRFLDGPWPSLELFIRYIVRLDEIVSGSSPPFVVLTQTNPLKLVVTPVRERLCRDVANLKLALWVIYVDPDEDPFFFANAARAGSFDLIDENGGKDEPVRVWTPAEKMSDGSTVQYVILTPQTACDDYLPARVAGLWEDVLAKPPEPITSTKLRAMLNATELKPFRRR